MVFNWSAPYVLDEVHYTYPLGGVLYVLGGVLHMCQMECYIFSGWAGGVRWSILIGLVGCGGAF